MVEERTLSHKYVFGILGRTKQFQMSEQDVFQSSPEYRRVFAAYREGMNATNAFYQVLSFYKVAEGIRSLRAERRTQTQDQRLVTYPEERIPEQLEDIGVDFLETASFKPFLGQKFTRVLDHYRSLIRNAVAHLDPMQNVLDIDRYDDVLTCLIAVPVLRYVARSMIRSELQSRKNSEQEPPPLPVQGSDVVNM